MYLTQNINFLYLSFLAISEVIHYKHDRIFCSTVHVFLGTCMVGELFSAWCFGEGVFFFLITPPTLL